MYRYVGFIWDPDDPLASKCAAGFSARFEDSPRWQRIAQYPGLDVFNRRGEREEMQCYVLPEEYGIVLGRLFPANMDSWTQSWRPDISISEAKAIVETGGERLIDNYWGGYIAFLNSRRERFAIRDCSGRIPCYRTRASGVEMIFADVSDLDRLELPTRTVNWRYLVAFIASNDMEIRETAFEEVTEVLAGESLIIDKGDHRQAPIWDPRRICMQDVIEDSAEAAKLMFSTTQNCISAWASIYDNILHNLSGGFDSAVVLGCLSKAPSRPVVTCINRFSADPAGDERMFARLAATQAGVNLIERSWSASRRLLDDRLLDMPKRVKPSIPAMIQMLDVDLQGEIAAQVSPDMYWTGQGGDHLFFQMKSPLGVADYIRRHGIGRRLWSVIQDGSRVAGVSYWSTIRAGLARGTSKGAQRDGSGGFLNGNVRPPELKEYSAHPWTDHAEGIPEGKQEQIRYLAQVVNRERPIPGFAFSDAHHPLLSQPLIELCLRIPIYLLVEGGRRRGLAKRTFQNTVPSQIIERESKGTTMAHILELLHLSQPYIAELLLDGVLVNKGILSRKALEPYISQSRPLGAAQLFPLLASVSAEIWIRSCLKKPSNDAA